jgi:hypothetical protein
MMMIGGAPEVFMSKNIPAFRISNFIVIHVPMIHDFEPMAYTSFRNLSMLIAPLVGIYY